MSREYPFHDGTPVLADRTEEAARVAARWWADHVRNKTPKNNGEPMHGVMADMVTASITKGMTADDLEQLAQRFEDALYAEILSDKDLHDPTKVDAHKNGRISYSRARASVDYGPGTLLALACLAAEGVRPNGTAFPEGKLGNMLPWKTDLTISAVGVSGRAGDGATSGPIWTAWELLRVGGPRSEVRVVDRWKPSRGYAPGTWVNGGNKEAMVALVTLAGLPDVEPQVIARVLRGRVDVDAYGNSPEDGIYGAFREECGGYLALVMP